MNDKFIMDKMKITSDHFIQTIHLVFVEYNGKTYTREKVISNGNKTLLCWTLKHKNKHGTFDNVERISDEKTLKILNDEYKKLKIKPIIIKI